MGFKVGTQVTVDNALKMMMVQSANDMAVVLAEGVSGSIDNFAERDDRTAQRLGMTQTNFVNPNGLPADEQITSARDLAILARALIREFPQYSSYWHIPAIKFGKRIVRNYNPLIGRYPGADGMKTGFICASGFNLVATATRDNKQLIAVVLGAPSGAARAVKAAEMLENGFTQNPLSWLIPSLGTVDQLKPIEAAPPNLKDEMCGSHRKHNQADDDEEADCRHDADDNNVSAGMPQFSVLLSALRAPTARNANLFPTMPAGEPIVVYTGPTRSPADLANLAADRRRPNPPEEGQAEARRAQPAMPAADAKPTDLKPAAAKPTPQNPRPQSQPRPSPLPQSRPGRQAQRRQVHVSRRPLEPAVVLGARGKPAARTGHAKKASQAQSRRYALARRVASAALVV